MRQDTFSWICAGIGAACVAVLLFFSHEAKPVHGQVTSACTSSCTISTTYKQSTVTLSGNAAITFAPGFYMGQDHLTRICEDSTGGWMPASITNYSGPGLATSQTAAGTCTDFAMRWNGTIWGAGPVVVTPASISAEPLHPTYTSPSIATVGIVSYGTTTIPLVVSGITTDKWFNCGLMGAGASLSNFAWGANVITAGTITFYVKNTTLATLTGTPAVNVVCKQQN